MSTKPQVLLGTGISFLAHNQGLKTTVNDPLIVGWE